MKSEKGITLVSLTVYIIAMVIVVAIIATISNFFYKNVQNINIDIDPITEFTTFNSYFSDEVNHENLKVLECKSDKNQNYIVFSNGVQYTYIPENRGVYRNKVKINRNVKNCNFEEKIENGKTIITVYFQAGDQNRTISYTLAN